MRIASYTRQPLEDAVYAKRLAYSCHFALQDEVGAFYALNHNSGVLFVKATENQDGSLNPKSMKNPWLFSRKEGGYGVFAVRTLANGETDTEDLGTAVLWTSKDLVRYEEKGLVKLADGPIMAVRCAYVEKASETANGGSATNEVAGRDAKGFYRLQWQQSNGQWHEAKERISSLEELRIGDASVKLAGVAISEDQSIEDGISLDAPCTMKVDAGSDASQAGNESPFAGIQGAVPCNCIEIPDALGAYLLKKLMPATQVGVVAPAELKAGSEAELKKVMVNALYSDGTQVPKHVIWDAESLAQIDFNLPGKYSLKGKLTQPHFEFPVCTDRADPCVCRWNGKYYYIATNDADGNHTLYMRCADSLEGIRDAEEHLILDSTTYDIGGLLWAPEFHVIDGRMYLFHACTPGPFFCEESHVMALREGGDPLKKEDWSRPMRVVRADGSDICEAGKEITLDMTEFEWQGELYVIWSQRQFLPKDLGAWLYIAKLNREKPWMLASDTVVLSKPEYGWANNHTFVDEGPFALIRGDKLYVTFSSAAVDSTYVVGLLQIEAGKDLLDPKNWYKNNYPLFTSRSYEGEYGTGHNAYVIDEDGITWNTYHARPGVDGPRSTGIRRVHFDMDGEPMLDVIEELDLRPDYSEFETTLVVE
ncbi:MAG: family 43 glycosylhydrolase [Acetatifactor sp.]|nr:family 43 glycosylhydrolase [Acetatifactor sp.]